MARVCAVTGKTVHFGNNVSHSKRRTRRRWQPNLHPVSFPSELLGRTVTLRISTAAMRTIEHNGGIDSFMQKAKAATLGKDARTVKKAIDAAAASKAA